MQARVVATGPAEGIELLSGGGVAIRTPFAAATIGVTAVAEIAEKRFEEHHVRDDATAPILSRERR